jgi:hypothetical protein
MQNLVTRRVPQVTLPHRGQKSIGSLTKFLNGNIDESLKHSFASLQRLRRRLNRLFTSLTRRHFNAEDYENARHRANESATNKWGKILSESLISEVIKLCKKKMLKKREEFYLLTTALASAKAAESLVDC